MIRPPRNSVHFRLCLTGSVVAGAQAEPLIPELGPIIARGPTVIAMVS